MLADVPAPNRKQMAVERVLIRSCDDAFGTRAVVGANKQSESWPPVVCATIFSRAGG